MGRERALSLAHEVELRNGSTLPESVTARVRVFLDFLRGTRDAEIIDAARELG